MENKPYLIFNINGSLYGIVLFCVQEIIPLPELTPLAETPRDIVGVLNLRGNIIPIMDFSLRLGYRPQEYSLTDSIVVIEWQGFRMGFIVNQVHEVQNLCPEQIKTELAYGREIATQVTHFIEGIAKVEAEITMLIDPEILIHYSDLVKPKIPDVTKDYIELESRLEPEGLYKQKLVFYPHATPEERAILKRRAENLRHFTDREDFSNLIPLAVVGLNDEYFGLDLEIVHEFTDIRKVTPVPCCPPHIVGNMNLRGEILTLVDIRTALKMQMNNLRIPHKAIVVFINDLVVGVAVEQVFDVMYLHPSLIAPVPTAIHSINNEYLKGTAPYQGEMMSLLDLGKLLIQGDLIVNEEV